MGKIKTVLFKLHLWLGLPAGLVIFVISITGSIYVFKSEIQAALNPWRFVQAQNEPFAPPSQLIDTARAYVPNAEPTGLTYDGREGAAAVGFWIQNDDFMEFKVVFMNPYTANFIRLQKPIAKGQFNFFEFIESGHTRLWLPEKIGKPLVGISVILFVIILITGIVMWWPVVMNRNTLKRKLTVNLKADFKRLKFDLHHAPGMYVLLFALLLACTGLTWSFKGFDNAIYFLASGGQKKIEHQHPHSMVPNELTAQTNLSHVLDTAFYMALNEDNNPQRIYISPTLSDADDAIEIVFYKHKGKFYHQNTYFFDRYTLKPLRIKGDRYDEAILADKLNGMYYDIHTGAIAGIAGKILVFLVGLICASLPVSGFIIWLSRRKMQQKIRARE